MVRVYSDRLDLIRDIAPPRAVCVEVGVLEGGLADLILQHTTPMQLHLIDIWAIVKTCGGSRETDEEGLEALLTVSKRFQPAIRNGQVVLHQGWSSSTLSLFPQGYFDWAYIDAGHSEEDVYRDLAAVGRTITPGGKIAGHDIAMPDVEDKVRYHYPSVRKAVERFCVEYGWEITGVTEVRPQPQRIDHTTPQTQSYVLERVA